MQINFKPESRKVVLYGSEYTGKGYSTAKYIGTFTVDGGPTREIYEKLTDKEKMQLRDWMDSFEQKEQLKYIESLHDRIKLATAAITIDKVMPSKREVKK